MLKRILPTIGIMGILPTIGIMAAALLMSAAQAHAFSAYVSPPRAVLKGAPGEKISYAIDISHSDAKPGSYKFYTNDWTISEAGDLSFSSDLSESSCRPWVAIERPQIVLSQGRSHKYRLEIDVPKDAVDVECRFALMVEGVEPGATHEGAARIQAVGRIAVVFYVTVGSTKASTTLVDVVTGSKGPSVVVKNTGSAHERLEGSAKVIDASGKESDAIIADSPVLPSHVRHLRIQLPEGSKFDPSKLTLISATIEGSGGSKINFKR